MCLLSHWKKRSCILLHQLFKFMQLKECNLITLLQIKKVKDQQAKNERNLILENKAFRNSKEISWITNMSISTTTSKWILMHYLNLMRLSLSNFLFRWLLKSQTFKKKICNQSKGKLKLNQLEIQKHKLLTSLALMCPILKSCNFQTSRVLNVHWKETE